MKPGDSVRLHLKDEVIEGILMPDQDDSYIVKLGSGYNISVKKQEVRKAEVVKGRASKEAKPRPVKKNPNLPDITILHTGGTIASKVDYETGAVSSQTTPEQIIESVPELARIANIRTETVFQMFSEDLEPVHWEMLAEAIAREVKNRPKGIIVGMGTDTIEYVSSALSFALQGIDIPVIILGSQRSSDRPSSDAAMNLTCAAHFIATTDFKGVGVCLHDTTEDKACLVIEGNHVKKMHTSRRDTFRPVNRRPIARVSPDGKVTYVRKDYNREAGGLDLRAKFSGRVALFKTYPGMRAGELDWAAKNAEGLVIEGYAFGQMPINDMDEHTRQHPELLKKVQAIAKKIPVMMVSQRPYGLTTMDVYSTGRLLLDAGVIEGKVLSHVGYVKLCWLLANHPDNARELISRNICGEIVERIEEDTFLI
ncbi:MAG: Glu-tRNA(Gln) amidotransferase subunit GatD [DPANN group archaeon]|nr:Glu-tRNA(Gln) amidotransferase subunit GatD [DPANN group archaeon]